MEKKEGQRRKEKRFSCALYLYWQKTLYDVTKEQMNSVLSALRTFAFTLFGYPDLKKIPLYC